MAYLILDLASTAIDGAADFIQEPSAPANYKNAEAISGYVREKKAELLKNAALDIDLGRITAIGTWFEGQDPFCTLCKDDGQERATLIMLLTNITRDTVLISYNGFKFDWPLLMRRCLYLGLKPPSINLDRYRSPHLDLWNLLSYNGAVPAHSLTWYAKRLGWTDLVKPLSGAEEATAAQEGKWAELEQAVLHDLHATQRLGAWMGLLKPWPVVEAVL